MILPGGRLGVLTRLCQVFAVAGVSAVQEVECASDVHFFAKEHFLCRRELMVEISHSKIGCYACDGIVDG
ncbi:MAG TPA: hypothetical protein EYN66_12625 [Myxococcales bacterium]|nr:hypothetical protein [Myxococcales bacterium]